MTVLLRGRLADPIGRHLEIEAAENRWIGRLPAIVGNVVAGQDQRITTADQVELLPPVSGR